MMMTLLLLSIGLGVGAFGTLIGAGGGFVLVPILLLLYPDKSPESITAVSLAVVFFNALSGTVAYQRLKRIDFRSGFLFSAATIPGSILGAWVVRFIPRSLFDGIFGILLLALAAYLLLLPGKDRNKAPVISEAHFIRQITDSDSNVYTYGYHPALGIGISLVVGFVSSLLGIGGGIIHVPALVNALNFPVHIATATSHFVLSIMAFSGSLVHYISGELAASLSLIGPLAIGAIAGAQVGARLSNRIHGTAIIRLLAVALGLVGLRILILAIHNH